MSSSYKLSSPNVDDWNERWKNDDTTWHRDEVNPLLIKHQENLLIKPNCKVLFPLCGKTVDMKYLADLKHKIVGVEYSEKAVLDYFTENKLQYKMSTCELNKSYKVYEAVDTNITIFQGDFFSVTKDLIGEVDAIFDRGSLVALNPSDREKYAKIITQLMSPNTRYMIHAFTYDQTKYGGPPFSVSEETMKKLFGDKLDIEVLFTGPRPELALKFNVDSWIDALYYLTSK